MYNQDHDIEKELEMLKNSITPSGDLMRNITAIPKPRTSRYAFRILLPVAAMAVLVIILTKGQKENPTQHEEISTDDIITSIVNDALDEQLIAAESDADVALLDSDRAALDSFAAAYDSNEY